MRIDSSPTRPDNRRQRRSLQRAAGGSRLMRLPPSGPQETPCSLWGDSLHSAHCQRMHEPASGQRPNGFCGDCLDHRAITAHPRFMHHDKEGNHPNNPESHDNILSCVSGGPKGPMRRAFVEQEASGAGVCAACQSDCLATGFLPTISFLPQHLFPAHPFGLTKKNLKSTVPQSIMGNTPLQKKIATGARG